MKRINDATGSYVSVWPSNSIEDIILIEINGEVCAIHYNDALVLAGYMEETARELFRKNKEKND